MQTFQHVFAYHAFLRCRCNAKTLLHDELLERSKSSRLVMMCPETHEEPEERWKREFLGVSASSGPKIYPKYPLPIQKATPPFWNPGGLTPHTGSGAESSGTVHDNSCRSSFASTVCGLRSCENQSGEKPPILRACCLLWLLVKAGVTL